MSLPNNKYITLKRVQQVLKMYYLFIILQFTTHYITNSLKFNKTKSYIF